MGYDTGTEKLFVELEDHIAFLTFNDPAKHNPLSREVREALPPTLRALQADPEVRVVVIAGAGGKAFVSGADISEFANQRTTPEARAAYDRAAADSGRAWSGLEKPVLAMIQGFCMGGGLLTALQADIRIASDESQFGIPAAKLGLGYGFGGVEALIEHIGPAWAAEILFSARRFSASEALRIGLVNHVVRGEDLRETVVDLARAISENAPLTVVACKAAIRAAIQDPDRRDLKRVTEMVEACFRSEDYREGQAAFLEKRSPKFTGR